MSIDFNIFSSFKEIETYIQPNYIFYDFCVNTVNKNINEDEYTIIAITGKPGVGKSTLAIETAVYTQKYAFLRYGIESPFGIQNIFFELPTFFEELSSRIDIKNNIFVLDDPNIGIFLTTENQKFNDFLRTARTKNIFLIITLPSTKNLPLITVQNYIKIVFFIKNRDKNNIITLKPQKPIFQSSRDNIDNKELKKEMQLVTASDLMISKVRINSLPFNIPPNILIKSIKVPSLTDKIDEFPNLPIILKEYKKFREEKPISVIKAKNIEKEKNLDIIQNIVREINENEMYKSIIISRGVANKKCIKEIFKVDDTIATFVRNYLNNMIKKTEKSLPKIKIKEQKDKKYRKRDSNIEIKLQEDKNIIKNFIKELKKENVMSGMLMD